MSRILPVLALGGRAVYIPYHLTWTYEAAIQPEQTPEGYFQLEHLGLLPALVESLSNS
jgi:putative hydrolase of the HAD superfamily